MSENQTPSRRGSDESDLGSVLRGAIRKEMQAQDSMMPVEVVSYNRATNRATVKHLVQMRGSDGEKVDRAQIASIRVMQPGNGAYSMSLPIKPGDKGWILAGDRDISLFQQDVDKVDAPNTDRMHSFQDGLFMPDAMKMGDAPAGEGDRVVIGANGGSAFISFDEAGVYITAGGTRLEITAAGFKVTGPMTTENGALIKNGLKVEGGTVRHNAKNIGDDHTHTGVTPGGGNTSVPNA